MTVRPDAPPAECPAPSSDAFGIRLDADAWFQRLRLADAPTPSGDRLARLGDYELLGMAGRGGQGVVFKARQPGTQRFVAIKRLGAGSFAGADAQARFQREVRAAATLDHPGIVTVYGADVVDDQPLMLMQWVDGLPIDRWAAGGNDSTTKPPDHEQAEQPGVRNGGRRRENSVNPARRPVRDILELFVLVCNAVQHAHQRGVIHRDLKPSNILVDAADRPHVLDFGLAKLLSPDDSGIDPMTQTGFVGTPVYASPEQLRGDRARIDVRTDVYSLGAILYQALTGRTTVDPALPLACIAAAAENPSVTAPSKLDTALKRELDAIVLKAVHSDREQRYPSVEALRADLQRYLDGVPVSAHPPSVAYRASKFVRRHKASSALAATSLLALIALGIVSTAQAARERGLRAAAQTHAKAAEREAESLRGTVELLLRVLRGVSQGSGASRNALPVSNVADVITQALAERPLDIPPELLAELHSIGGSVLHDAKELESAVDHRVSALEIASGVFGLEHEKTVRLRMWLAHALSRAARHDEAEAEAQEAVSASERVAGSVSSLHVATLNMLAYCLSRAQKYDQSMAASLQAVSIIDQLQPALPESEARAEDGARLRACTNTGDILVMQGRFDEALATYEGALELFEVRNPPGSRNSRDAAWHCLRFGSLLYRVGELERAERVLATAVAIRKQADGLLFSKTSEALRWHGRALHALGRLSEADDAYEEALIPFAHSGRLITTAARIRFERAAVMLADGRDDEGRRQLIRAVSKGKARAPGSKWDAVAQEVELALRENGFRVDQTLLPGLGEWGWLIDPELSP